ncbi:MAG: hypothetical protein Q8N09_11050 [Thermodesulfovibrionia bacterium]|nr:hypothetical protein [Thermodesulfovibrionia bacterium]
MPTDGNKIDEEFWLLMQRFDPDYIYYYKKTMMDFKLLAPREYKDSLQNNTDEFIKENPESDPKQVKDDIDKQAESINIDKFHISQDLELELKNRLNPFEEPIHQIGAISGVSFPLTALSTAFKGITIRQSILSPYIEASKELALCLYSIVGKVDKLFRGETILLSEYDITPHFWNADNIHEFIQSALKKKEDYWKMPFPKTMVGMAFYSSNFDSQIKPVIILGDTIKDFCLYYNLSRLNLNTYWLPKKLLEAYVKESSKKNIKVLFEGETSYVYWLKDLIENVLRSKSEKKFYLYSTSSEDADFDLVKRAFNEATLIISDKPISDYIEIQTDIEKLLQGRVKVLEEDVPKKNYVEQFYQGESINVLNTPIPKKFPKIPPHNHNWIADVLIENYLPPQIKSLGAKAIIHKNYNNDVIRVSSEGFSYFCPHFAYFSGWGGIENILVRPKLRLFEDFIIIEELFKEKNYHVKYSDKGDYHREMCLKFGGFDKLSDFLNEGKKRTLLLKYCDGNESKEGEGTFLQNERRRYLWFDEIEKILQADTRNTIDYLLEREILYRGFIFKCQKCRYDAWYPIEEVTSKFRCSRCRTEQIFKPEHWKIPHNEPRWYYKLDEVVFQGIRHNNYIPILTIRKLKKLSKYGFHYVPEIEIRKDPMTEKPDLEIDFVVIIDGKIYFGEATKEDKLEKDTSKEQEKLTKLKNIAIAVQAKKIILATFSDEWSEGTKNNIEKTFGQTVCLPLTFARGDLL